MERILKEVICSWGKASNKSGALSSDRTSMNGQRSKSRLACSDCDGERSSSQISRQIAGQDRSSLSSVESTRASQRTSSGSVRTQHSPQNPADLNT